MDPPAVERVQSEHNGELQQFLSCFEAMRRESQEDRKIMNKQSEEVCKAMQVIQEKFCVFQESFNFLHDRSVLIEKQGKIESPF